MIKKGLVFGIVVLFLGMTLVPLAGSLSMEKQAIQESLPFAYSTSGTSGISLITVIVAGVIIGLNDWIVSNVDVSFSKSSDDIASVYYRIDYSEWTEYTNPFIISEDGEDICLEWYAVNYEGNQSDVDGPFIFDMDQTEPEIYLEYELTGGNPEQGWDLLFTATATDAMSGMDRVEFCFNNELQDIVYGPGPTYTWEIFGCHAPIIIGATAFDKAGNSDWDGTPGGSNSAFSESSMFHTDINEESSINGCLDDVLSSEIVERENHRITEKVPSGTPLGGVFDPTYVVVVSDRKIGGNDWIVSDVSISMFYESERIVEVYYQIDDGGWMLYAEPLVISDDGVHSFSWYVVDSEGYVSAPDSISFKIDQTRPEINLIRKRIAIDKIKFIADVYDETSNINKVHFLIDNRAEFTDYDFPYEYIWTGFFNEKVTATVYDKAGNRNSSSMNTWHIRSHSQQSSNPLSPRFLERFPMLERLLNLIK